MRSDNEQKIGAVLQAFLKANGLEDKFLETEIYQRWEELAGKAINLKTKKIEYKKGVLTVRLTSATLRQELQMRRTALLEHINMRLPQHPVQEIRFL